MLSNIENRKEQTNEDRIREEIKRGRKILTAAAIDNLPSYLTAKEREIEEILFPIWKEAVHEILLDMCPCKTGAKDTVCLLEQDKEILIKLSERVYYSFEKFKDFVLKAREAGFKAVLEESI